MVVITKVVMLHPPPRARKKMTTPGTLLRPTEVTVGDLVQVYVRHGVGRCMYGEH